jgi:hypothetical protein
MSEKPKDVQDEVIESLLHYCEELLAQRTAYRKILLDSRMSKQTLQDLLDGEIEGTRKRLEPIYHTLWAYLRVEDWKGFRNTVQQALDRIQIGKE